MTQVFLWILEVQLVLWVQVLPSHRWVQQILVGQRDLELLLRHHFRVYLQILSHQLLLFHLWAQKDQRCPSLLAFPEDLEDPDHLEHRWDQGYPLAHLDQVHQEFP